MVQEEYTSLVNQTISQPPASPPSQDEQQFQQPRQTVQIATYEDCSLVAEGLTSEVYHSPSTSRALKLIVTVLPPHNPVREARILRSLSEAPGVVRLIDVLHDAQARPVLVFPYYPFTLEDLLSRKHVFTSADTRVIFRDVAAALVDVHAKGVIHRDIKPSAILLTPAHDAVLSDFGISWDPASAAAEPADKKYLDIGSGPYRAPEVLLAHAPYDTSIDVWGLGVVLSAVLRGAENGAMFTCPPVHEDGNQLGLLLSIVTTLGTPTKESWPEAGGFRCNPFDMFRSFEGKDWGEILEGVDEQWCGLVRGMVKYSARFTAQEVGLTDLIPFISCC